MVATVLPIGDVRSRALAGAGYGGVVQISVGNSYGSGSLLYDGVTILTAAHVVPSGAADIVVMLETAEGRVFRDVREVEIRPDYDADFNNDVAILWLAEAAPASAQRYELYRGGDEWGKDLNLVGYGCQGDGLSPYQPWSQAPQRLLAENRVEGDPYLLRSQLGSGIGWTPKRDSQFMADFDDGKPEHDALGLLIGQADLGLGLREGFVAPGDSGGPGFIDGKVAGVASYVTTLHTATAHPDIDGVDNNNTFGEIAVWQRVSYFQQWIDQSLRSHYDHAPASFAAVQSTVVEGNAEGGRTYFMVRFTGQRTSPDEVVSVEYATRDGEARAGEDYIAAHGVLNLYPGENQALIPVEILGDVRPEAPEDFYLDVYNPVGGSFGDGMARLTAVRTILDDDGALSL